MTNLVITCHGETRMSQRGIRESDLDLILDYGTEIGQDRLMLTRRDAARLISERKKEIAKIERLTDKVIVVSEGCLVTAYHQAHSARPISEHKTRHRGRR